MCRYFSILKKMFSAYQMLFDKWFWLNECQIDLRLEFIEFIATSPVSIDRLEHRNRIQIAVLLNLSVQHAKSVGLNSKALRQFVDVNGFSRQSIQMISSAFALCAALFCYKWPLHHHWACSFWRRKKNSTKYNRPNDIHN